MTERILAENESLKRKLEAVKEPLFRLKGLLKTPPSLDCVSQTNEEGEQRNFFIREVFEKSLNVYCKGGFNLVEVVWDALEFQHLESTETEK